MASPSRVYTVVDGERSGEHPERVSPIHSGRTAAASGAGCDADSARGSPGRPVRQGPGRSSRRGRDRLRRRRHEGGRAVWRCAEDPGFRTAYIYDHLSWRSFRDGPRFGAVPTLTAAAGVTERMRSGTLVTWLNFGHPVTLAKDLIFLDDVSVGRITLGIGACATGFDATALGQEPRTARERADRFGEFVPLLDRLLDRLLTADSVSCEGDFHWVHEARNIPGCPSRWPPPARAGRAGVGDHR